MDKPRSVPNLGACPMPVMNIRETIDEKRWVTGACSFFFILFCFGGKDLLSTGPTNIHTKEKMEPRVVPIPEWHVVDNNISVGSIFEKFDNMIDLCFTRKHNIAANRVTGLANRKIFWWSIMLTSLWFVIIVRGHFLSYASGKNLTTSEKTTVISAKKWFQH